MDSSISLNASDGICINFEVPIKNFYKEENNGILKERKINSVLFWVYVYLKTTTTVNQKLKIKLTNNLNQAHSKNSTITLKYINDGWNTINITNIFHLPHITPNSDINKSFKVSLQLKCSKGCLIGLSDDYLEDYKSNLIVFHQETYKPLLTFKFKQDEFESFNSFINREKQESISNKASYKAKGLNESFVSRLCSNKADIGNEECCKLTFH